MVAPGGDEGPGNREAVADLTERVAAGLREVSLDYDATHDDVALYEASRVAVRRPDGDPHTLLSLDEIERTTRAMSQAPPAERSAVVEAMDAYNSILELLHLTDADIIPGNTPERMRERVGLGLVKVVGLAPFAAVGAAIDLLPYGVVRVAAARRPMERVSRANFTLLVSMVAFPLTWLGWGLFGRRLGLRRPWRVALLAGPVCGHAAVAWYEQVSAVRSARLRWRRTTTLADVLDDVRAQRAVVVEAVSAAVAAAGA